MPNVIQTIQLDAGEFLAFLDKILPIVEAYVPPIAAAAGPIGWGVSGAAALLPLLSKIPIGPVFTAEVQQSYLDRIQARVLLDFSAPAWQKSQPTPPAPPQPVPGPAPQPPG